MSTLTVANIADPVNAGVFFPIPPRTVTLPGTDNSTSVATTAYVRSAVSAAVGFPITLGSTTVNGGATVSGVVGLAINNSVIGGTTPAAASFTTLTSTSTTTLAATTASSLSCANVSLTGGSINGTPIGGTTPSTAAFTTLSATGTVNFSSSPSVQVPTAAPGTSSNVVASTAFVANAVGGSGGSVVALAAPPGAVCLFAMAVTSSPPTGWLKANGASVLRTDFPNLFAVIGTMFGSVDGTHFTLPDFRGEFLRCFDDGRGVDSGRTIGSWQQATRVLSAMYAGRGWDSIPDPGYNSIAADLDSANELVFNNSEETFGTGGDYNVGVQVYAARVRVRNYALLACIKY